MQTPASVRPLLAAFIVASSAFLIAPASHAQPDTAAIVNLSPADAQIVGREPKVVKVNGADAIVGWRLPEDSLHWQAKIPAPGIYNVILEYGYAGKTGSMVEVAVGDQGVQTQILGTLDAENFASSLMGQVQITQAGMVPIKLSVVQKHGTMVMNFRSLRLVRTNATTLSEPAKPAVHPAGP